MILTLIAGVITGFVISVPPMGPISFALIGKGFKDQFREGMSIAMGSAFMDFIYAMMAFGGISLFISLLPETLEQLYRNNFYIIQIFLIIAGCVIVIEYGFKISQSRITYDTIKQKENVLKATQLKAVEVGKAAADMTHVKKNTEGANHFGLFMMGVMLCISSITLPASWIAIVGYIKGLGVLDRSFLGGLIFSGGAFVGTVLWFYFLLKLITGNNHRINPLTINKLNTGAGIILIILGLVLFFKAIDTVFST